MRRLRKRPHPPQVAPATAEEIAAELAAELEELTARTAAARVDRWRDEVTPPGWRP